MQRTDLAAVANGDAVAVELVHEVVGHRLAQVGAAVEQRHERAAAGSHHTAAWPAELPPPTTPTPEAPQSGASGGSAA